MAARKKTKKKAKRRVTKKKATRKPARRKTTKKKAKRRVTKKKTARRKTTKRKTTRKKATRKAARKPARRKTTKKKTARKKSRRKPSAAFMAPLTPSDALAAVVGAKPLPRTQVTKKLWNYIKKRKLQDKVNRRMIRADAALKKVFGGKSAVDMFQMTKLVSRHLR